MKDLIKRLRELEANATENWSKHKDQLVFRTSNGSHYTFAEKVKESEMDLIVETRNALPKLLDAAETGDEALREASRLHQQLAKAEDEIERMSIEFKSFVGMVKMNTELKNQLAEDREILQDFVIGWSKGDDMVGPFKRARAFLEKYK